MKCRHFNKWNGCIFSPVICGGYMMGTTGKKILSVFMPGEALGGRFYQNKGPCETRWLYLPFLFLCVTCLELVITICCQKKWVQFTSNSYVGWVQANMVTDPFLCFQKCNRSWGQRNLYSCLPRTLGRLLPVSGCYPVWLVRTAGLSSSS
jgi:hypothetical protein